jgi:hypothetical protein
MAPSVAQIDGNNTYSLDFAVKPISKTVTSSGKVKRQIEEEGHNTTAKVFSLDYRQNPEG